MKTYEALFEALEIPADERDTERLEGLIEGSLAPREKRYVRMRFGDEPCTNEEIAQQLGNKLPWIISMERSSLRKLSIAWREARVRDPGVVEGIGLLLAALKVEATPAAMRELAYAFLLILIPDEESFIRMRYGIGCERASVKDMAATGVASESWVRNQEKVLLGRLGAHMAKAHRA